MIQPAIEYSQRDRFLIADLIKLKQELESVSDALSRIESRDLLNFFVNLMRYRPLLKTLPSRWSQLQTHDFEHLIAFFDPHLTGKIQMNHIFTLICLQNSHIPDDLSLSEYRQRLEELGSKGKISIEKFCSAAAFFDNSQDQKKQYERSNKFNRVYHLKRLLFEVNGDVKRVNLFHQNIMDIGIFTNILACRNMPHVNLKNKTYFDVLFQTLSN